MNILLRLILLVCLVFASQSYAATTAVTYGYGVDAFQKVFGKGADDIVARIDAAAVSGGDVTKVPKGVASTDFDSVTNFFKSNGKLPDNYLTKAEAKALGWDPKKGNLADVAPGKSIGGDVFKNNEGLLPNAPNRTWYEADINYTSGYRNSDRFVYSSDGLLYKSTDHYKTFIKVE